MRKRELERIHTGSGFIVVRVIWSELRDVQALAARIHTALTVGRWALAADLVTGASAAAKPVRIALTASR